MLIYESFLELKNTIIMNMKHPVALINHLLSLSHLVLRDHFKVKSYNYIVL